MNPHEIETRVKDYYEDKLIRFGTTPRGVDWNSNESQFLRLQVLLRALNVEALEKCSLLDYGCGYGALVDLITEIPSNVTYTGFDLSEAMIEAARQRHQLHEPSVSFTTLRPNVTFDFVVASGVFNVKGDTSDANWEEYVFHCISEMSETANIGFAFNMLTIYSDAHRRRSDLFYADPMKIFDTCRRSYSPRVSLIHDYELFEFTVVVKR